MYRFDFSATRRRFVGQLPLGDEFPWRRIPAILCDTALLAVLFLCPLLLGGRHPAGRLLYVATIALLTVATLLARSVGKHQRWRLSGIEWLLGIGAALILFQTVPLPVGLFECLSPELTRRLTLWNHQLGGVVQLGTWNQLSVLPHATREALAIYVAHALLFLVVFQRINRLADVQWLLRMISLAATSLAVISLVQYLSGTEKFLWFFTHPSRLASRAVSGPYVNPNHLAHFLALGFGPLIWWMSESWQKVGKLKAGPTGNMFRRDAGDRRAQTTVIVLGIAGAVVILAGALTSSRGGIVMLVLAATTCILLLAFRGLVGRRAVAGLAIVAAVALVGIGIHGADHVRDELATIASGSMADIDTNHARQKIWAANLAIGSAFPLFGTGVGSHAEVYKLFYAHPANVEYTHAENIYLQVLSETGIVGLGLLIVALGIASRWIWRTVQWAPAPPAQAAVAALTAVVAVSVTHALFDFPWYLPSCMSVAVIALAALCRLSSEIDSRTKSAELILTRRSWLGSALVTAVVLAILASYSIPPARASFAWNRYLRLSLQRHSANRFKESDRRPLGDRPDAHADRDERMLSELREVLRLNPNSDRANLRVASICLRIFERQQRESENAMALSQIRDAALASNFSSLESLNAWVSAAVGENRDSLDAALTHARRAIRLAPLSGRSYLYLSELGFLEGVGVDGIGQLISQAAQVRPYDAAILFSQGKEHALRGDVEGALEYWKRSFHQSDDYRELIIQRLAAQMPAIDFLTIFNPDGRTLKVLLGYYLQLNRDDQVAVVAPEVARVIEQEAQDQNGFSAVRHWHRAMAIHKLVGNTDRAIECARKAVLAAPNQYIARYRLADQLLSQQQYDEALEHLRWCLKRRPYDVKLKKRVRHLTSMHPPDIVTAELSPQSPTQRQMR